MKKLRKDIQGLRALAVLSVVLYHFNQKYIPSGFVGVDIFFVISGFLMTSIIYNGIINKSFSLLQFYIARSKRIIPALSAVVVLLLVFGYLFIEPLTYKEIGQHSLSSLLFYSNYVYFGESGYFDQSSKEKFLLHTWSLSVEWQFYIIYPLIMTAIYRLLPVKFFRPSLLLLFTASFLASIYITKQNSNYSYFMIATRSWEMLLGGVVCLYPISAKHSTRRAIEIIGISLIITSFFLFTEATPWPGISATIPTIGAALVITANTEKSLLSNNVLQYIGKISYSMYLVHWVILVSFKKLYIENSLLLFFVGLFSLSLVIYYSVERRKDFGYKHLIVYIGILFASYYVSINGINSRLDDVKAYQVNAQTFRNENEGHAGVRDSASVIYFNSTEKDFEYVLVGSSHAKHYYDYIIKSGKKVASFALDGCNSTKNYVSGYNFKLCSQRYQQTVEFINSHPGKKIIWATVWTTPTNKREPLFDESKVPYNDRLKNEIVHFANDIKGSGAYIYLIGDTPGSKKLMFECLAKNALPINKLLNSAGCEETEKKEDKPDNAALQFVATTSKNIHFIDARNALCDTNVCKVILNAKPVYTDYGHLSKEGAKIVGEYIFNQMEKH
ncbi:acyltransferase family protein [Aeromonas sanarellii]|uniref:acyltransferase family protein n=1 Tax=Aeromonas sanarellii TaxID=633415 RepID=UPI0038D19124